MENVIKSRIQLKYDTLTNWNSSNLVLKKGEVAIAEIPSNAENSGLTPPAIGMKVGDGTKTFIQLPWIQAVSGDVYAWAKAALKPTYDASEITGLSAYIQSVAGNGTSYQIVEGTGNNADKYYLQEQTTGSSTWTTVSTIDLSGTIARIKALEDWADLSYTLAEQINSAVTRSINNLDYTDTAVTHQFVTAVQEVNGKISVSRSALSTDDLASGTLPVSRGGTGVSSITSGEVVIGNGTSGVTTKAIDSTVTNESTNLITSGAVKAYVDSIMEGLGNAMHFIGIATNPITNGGTTNPGITGYSIVIAKAGDVVLYDNKEYVWDGSSWQLLGDEGSYAIKGSIVDADIASNANIAQSKISGLTAALNDKVDKESGKGLSEANFTSGEKTKLQGIETGAEVNIIEAVKVGDTALTVDSTDRSVTLGTLAGKNNISINELDSNLATKMSYITGQLHAIAYDGDVGNLTQDSGTILVIDCGNGSDKKYDT